MDRSKILVVFLILAFCFEPMLAVRSLDGDEWLQIQSLARGKVPSSSHSGCTYGLNGKGGCPNLKLKNFAGQLAHHLPHPTILINAAANFGVASVNKEIQK
ncbi:hypothetical protein JCGZ_23524 [Jatropha curcas]|uniref:Uncharacterized protein n=1 Tax=Jatropha curcas TaxID=180498 RepID=A0A067JIB2_JATCU|nr:hypothetical protein JCGZ_23524 [Jatropha curcas]